MTEQNEQIAGLNFTGYYYFNKKEIKRIRSLGCTMLVAGFKVYACEKYFAHQAIKLLRQRKKEQIRTLH